MKTICIKTNNSNLLDYLLNELKYIELDNIYFSTNKFKNYKNIIIHYKGTDINNFTDKISSILSFMIIDELEESFLKKLIIKNYFYFDTNEIEKILNICFDILSEDFNKIFNEKHNCLFNSFSSYLINNKTILLDGFINFRIKNYFKILENIIDDAVNSFIIEKEYNEFISLLKLYINSQPYGCNIVHLVYSSENCTLLDENKNIINISDDIFNAKYLSDITFSLNDYALNTLLSLLPKKIYLHLTDNYIDEFINTLCLVFENKIELCTECNICNLYKNKKILTKHIIKEQ